MAGQVLGGLLLQWDLAGLDWRPAFLINVPMGLASAAAAYRLQPRTQASRRPRLDALGALGALGVSGSLALGRAEGWPGDLDLAGRLGSGDGLTLPGGARRATRSRWST